jgi:hypothetical protein
VRNGVHYIAFWPFFGHCGIQPLQILDFCAHIRKILMKMQKLRTHHFSSVHYIKHYTFLHKHVKIADTTLFLYKCHHQFSYTKMSKLRTLHFFLSGVHYIKTLHIAIQTCQNCGLHLFLSGVHYIKIQQIHYTNMPKLRTTLFLI